MRRRLKDKVIMGKANDFKNHVMSKMYIGEEQNELEDIEDLDEEQIIQIF
jgi:hypothetical protein